MEKYHIDFLRLVRARPGYTATKGMSNWLTAARLAKPTREVPKPLVRLIPIDHVTAKVMLTEAGVEALRIAEHG